MHAHITHAHTLTHHARAHTHTHTHTHTGAMREGGMLQHDDDVDVLMDKPHFEKFRERVKKARDRDPHKKIIKMYGQVFCFANDGSNTYALMAAVRVDEAKVAQLRKQCCGNASKYGIVPTVTWGTAPLKHVQPWYNQQGCDALVGGMNRTNCNKDANPGATGEAGDPGAGAARYQCLEWGLDLFSDEDMGYARRINWTDHFFSLRTQSSQLVRRKFGPVSALSIPDDVGIRYLCETYGCDKPGHVIKKNAVRNEMATKLYEVNCGGHKTYDGCKGCSAGHDIPADWCHGDCAWMKEKKSCVIKENLVSCGKGGKTSGTGCHGCASDTAHRRQCGGDCAWSSQQKECLAGPMLVRCGDSLDNPHRSSSGCFGCADGHDSPKDW